jgi:uncharacterized protein
MNSTVIAKSGNGFYIRLFRLIFGLFLYALGILVTIKAQIGFAPWDVLHVGLANTLGMSIGQASILVGVLLVIVALVCGERVGLGTLLNMILIGVFFDMIMALDLIPAADNSFGGIGMLLLGLMIISLASYYYIGAGLGAGPRDSLMVALARKSGLPIGFCRGTIEVIAVLIGWKLGGMVGLGTVVAAFSIGFCIQFTFWLLKFDAKKVEHQSLFKMKDDIYGTM